MNLYDANMMLKLVTTLDRAFDFMGHRGTCPHEEVHTRPCNCGLNRLKDEVRSLMYEVRAWAEVNKPQ